MFRSVLINLPFLQNRRYPRWSQRFRMTSVETLACYPKAKINNVDFDETAN